MILLIDWCMVTTTITHKKIIECHCHCPHLQSPQYYDQQTEQLTLYSTTEDTWQANVWSSVCTSTYKSTFLLQSLKKKPYTCMYRMCVLITYLTPYMLLCSCTGFLMLYLYFPPSNTWRWFLNLHYHCVFLLHFFPLGVVVFMQQFLHSHKPCLFTIKTGCYWFQNSLWQ